MVVTHPEFTSRRLPLPTASSPYTTDRLVGARFSEEIGTMAVGNSGFVAAVKAK